MTTRFAAALRAWVAQAVTWHDPTVLGVAVATPDLESPDWSWLKWLPHVDIPAEADGVGPARYLSTKRRRAGRAAGAGAVRPSGVRRRAGGCVAALADHRRRPGLRPERLAAGGRAGRRHRRPPIGHRAAPGAVLGSRAADPADRRRRASSAGRPAAGSATSTAPTSSASTTPFTSRAGCPAGTPTRRTAACSRPPPAARRSPRCWEFRTHRGLTSRRCGRRDTATTSCGCRSVSRPPVSR